MLNLQPLLRCYRNATSIIFYIIIHSCNHWVNFAPDPTHPLPPGALSARADHAWHLIPSALRYDEVDNIRPLTERLFKATKAAGLEVELLIMDDESKGTARTEAIVGELASEGHEVRIHVRRKGQGRGLSSAVLLGFSMAK